MAFFRALGTGEGGSRLDRGPERALTRCFAAPSPAGAGEGNLEETTMADLRSNFVGIKSPNPFWLASAPPTDKEYNVVRAFKAGWGGVVLGGFVDK